MCIRDRAPRPPLARPGRAHSAGRAPKAPASGACCARKRPPSRRLSSPGRSGAGAGGRGSAPAP
eukprot:2295815-Alexandrium_andersonii.AAC.1